MVESLLPKQVVAGSNPVFRSKKETHVFCVCFLFGASDGIAHPFALAKRVRKFGVQRTPNLAKASAKHLRFS